MEDGTEQLNFFFAAIFVTCCIWAFRVHILEKKVYHWWMSKPLWLRASCEYFVFFYVCLVLLFADTLYHLADAIDCQFLGSQGLPLWIRFLTMGAPFCSLGSFVIGGFHLWQHQSAINRFSNGVLRRCPQRDKLIQVILLPVVYSLMSLSSMPALLRYCTGCQATEGFGVYAMQRSKAMFAAADLYEAWALYQFVALSLAEIEHVSKEMMRACSTWEGQNRDAVRSHIEHVGKAMSSLTTQGVLWFVFTCALSSMYDLVVANTEFTAGHYTAPSWVKGYDDEVYAMGFIVSCIAIMNVVSVESSLHGCMKDFQCARKFLSTKIMVSVAFVQAGVVNAFAVYYGMNDEVRSILYATLICYEVLGLSVFHLYAWPEDEPWLQSTEIGRRQCRIALNMFSTQVIKQYARRWSVKRAEKVKLHGDRIKEWRLLGILYPHRFHIVFLLKQLARDARQKVKETEIRKLSQPVFPVLRAAIGSRRETSRAIRFSVTSNDSEVPSKTFDSVRSIVRKSMLAITGWRKSVITESPYPIPVSSPMLDFARSPLLRKSTPAIFEHTGELLGSTEQKKRTSDLSLLDAHAPRKRTESLM
eukprot:TRINITY_DN13083_c0_g1_i1.p1 TRINITY_DN13083_c0_g1~~TRINITY_DN13083_c0_g1_i1.p1  ORF type:complete len:587 (-),score=51.99 TRINITY_DN13083_c0_g1_i1:26-1786(-)